MRKQNFSFLTINYTISNLLYAIGQGLLHRPMVHRLSDGPMDAKYYHCFRCSMISNALAICISWNEITYFYSLLWCHNFRSQLRICHPCIYTCQLRYFLKHKMNLGVSNIFHYSYHLIVSKLLFYLFWNVHINNLLIHKV